VCKSGVRLNRTLRPEVVRGLLLSSDASPAGDASAQTLTFRASSGQSITCRSPLTQKALAILLERWPLPVRFEDLAAQAGAKDEAAVEFLAGEMLTCMAAGVAEWRLGPPPFT